MTDLFDRISRLLGASLGDLDQIERTLTDGYAYSLSLEGERRRLERRVAVLSREIESGDVVSKARELADLARRLEDTSGELVRLRSRLFELRLRADDVRAGSAA